MSHHSTPAPDFYRLRYSVRGVDDDTTRERRFADRDEAWRAYHATTPAPGDWLYLEPGWQSDHGISVGPALTSKKG
jgi:hypothetical protein